MPRRLHRVQPALLSSARQLRQEAAPTEQKLWQHLRNRSLGGFKFRRQFPIANYVADFCCGECKLIVELDGDSHQEREQYDKKRTAILEGLGYQVIRYANTNVYENLESVLLDILKHCEGKKAALQSGPSPCLSPEYGGEEKEL